jgi:hypothetical protein
MAASTGPAALTAPDRYGSKPGDAGYLSCYGAERVTFQVVNSGVVYQFGHGSPPLFDGEPEVAMLPTIRSTATRCDAIRFRAQTPAAQLPAGQVQAKVQIDTWP